MSDPQPITLNQLAELGIDKAGHLFWRGQEVVTMLALPTVVNWAIVAGTVIGGLTLLWSIIRYFLDRHERRANAKSGEPSAST